VSLLIPTRNKLDILKPCVESILEKTTYKNFEIIILDNQSTDPDILAWFREIQTNHQVKVLLYNHPFNYSAINNFGVCYAKGSIIGLINNDVEVISENWLSEMVTHSCRQEIGCVGAKLYYSNGQIQHAGVILGLGHVAGHAHRFAERDADGYFGRLKLVQNYSAVTGACLLVRREIYEQVGGLNEQDLPVAYNDVDFCLRVQAAGYRNLWTPHAELYHHESVSRGEDDTPEKKARFDKEVAYMRNTWSKELDNDPCYNPNLSRLREDFSLREIF
jgi:GT2 family glycosyltransferase